MAIFGPSVNGHEALRGGRMHGGFKVVAAEEKAAKAREDAGEP
jgi:hypothetical protein